MESSPTYNAARPAGREHVPITPKGFIAIRIIQLVLAVILIGLVGYSLSQVTYTGGGLTIFTAVVTLITTIYILVAEFGSVKAYNYWAIMSLDIFLVIFWLISFAIVAATTAANAGYTEICGYYYCSYYGLGATLTGVLGAAAGLGAIEFILFLISLIIHSIALHRHRKAGLHCKPLNSTAAGASHGAGGIPLSTTAQSPAAEKRQAPVNQSTIHQHPQQSYEQPQHGQGYVQPSQVTTQTTTPQSQQIYHAPAPQYEQAPQSHDQSQHQNTSYVSPQQTTGSEYQQHQVPPNTYEAAP